MKYIIISLGSVTNAMKARELLVSNKIHAKLVKPNKVLSEKGCVYGIKISVYDYKSAVALLSNDGIPFSVLEGI